MGIDLVMWVYADPSAERLEKASEIFMSRSNIADPGYNCQVPGSAFITETNDEGRPYVELSTLSRYYGLHYPRGWWPQIYQGVVAIQELFPESDVYYGNDSYGCAGEPEGFHVVSEKFLSVRWQQWLIDNELEKDVAL